MANGICLQLTHTGSVGSPVYLSDVVDGTDGEAGYKKAGPMYVPVNGTVTLVLTSSVALSYESGTIRGYINTGVLTAAFDLGTGFRSTSVRTTAADTTLADDDWYILVNSVGGNVDVNLPSAATVPTGSPYVIKKISLDGNNVRIVPAGAETLDGVAAPVVFNVPLTVRSIISDGTNWWIV
jgi:hypothetical protein